MSSMNELFPRRLLIILIGLYAIHKHQAKDRQALSTVDDENEIVYAREETSKRKERLIQLSSRDCDTPDDVEAILESVDEYIAAKVYLDKTRNNVWKEPYVERAYTIAGEGISRMLSSPDQDGDLGMILEGPVKKLRDQLEFCPNSVLKKRIEETFETAANKAIRSIRERRSQQAKKALTILKRALPETPMIAMSSLLSVYSGTLESARLYLRGEMLTRAISMATGSGSVDGKQGSKKPVSIKQLVLLEILSAVVSVFKYRTQTIGKRRFVQNLKTDLFGALVSQDMVFFEKNDLWEVRHLIGNADYVCTALLNTPTTTLESFSRVVSSLLLLFKQSPKLSTFIFLFALPLKSLANSWLDRLQDYWEQSQTSLFIPNKSFSDVWQTLVEPRALKTMRSFAREPKEVRDFSRSIRAKDEQDETSALIFQLVSPARDALEKFVDVFGVWYGGKLVGENQMRAADLPSFVSLCSDTFDRARFLYAALGAFGAEVLDPAEKMHDLLSSEPSIGLYVPKYDPNLHLEFTIEFKDVHFAYPTRPQAEILRGVSFSIKRGEKIGIMGESGCGKSTVFALLERLYEPSKGQILIGGTPIQNINPLFLRERIAYVSQQSYMAKQTIKENLLYGRTRQFSKDPKKRDEFEDRKEEMDIKRALELAQCSFFLTDAARFPDGLLTDIGQNASKLSGGEVQRLALARALLCEPKPELLLLDEYTSALDETSQRKVQEAIEAIWEESGRQLTILSIAHRISNFKNVNRVIAMSKEGRVAEVGSPKDLLRDYPDGIFATFVKTSEVDFENDENK